MSEVRGTHEITTGMADLSLPGKALAPSLYEYQPLPSNRHIRLLTILPRPQAELPHPFWSDMATLHCSLKTVSLDENPEFDALSYTWGNPITVYEDAEQAKEGAETFEKPRQIFCDGRTLDITVNLYDALLAIRRIPGAMAFKEIVDRPRSDYIWIDAICINQQDTAERSAQVTIMDQIYSQAKITIIWLGRDDVFTRNGAQVLKDIWNIPQSIIPLMRQQNGKQLDSRDYKSLGLRNIGEMEWLSVYAFLNRSWFKRAWILQELALAHQPVALSGLFMMSWGLIVASCGVLHSSQWYTSIATVAECRMKGVSSALFQPSDPSDSRLPPEGIKSYLYQEEEQKQFVAPSAIYGIADVRAGLGIEDNFLKMTPYRKALNLTELMQFFRASSSTDPKDKIYALCGLLPMESFETPNLVQRIVPDYDKSVEHIYLEAAWFQLGSTNDLSFLGHVQDISQTRVKNLPSWVPDYSATLRPITLSEVRMNRTTSNPIGTLPFSADTGLEFVFPFSSLLPSSLRLRGVFYDVVADVGNFKRDYDLFGILNLVSKLLHIYWGDVTDHVNGSSAHEGGDVDFYFEAGYLKVKDPLSNPGKASESNETESSASAAEIVPHNSAPRLQTHVEVLWRTLIADCWELKHPAPLEAGYGFADSLIHDIQHSFNGTEKPKPTTGGDADEKPMFENDLSKKLTCLKTLATSEFNGFTTAQQSSNDSEPVYTTNIDPIFANIPREAMEKMLTRFMPEFQQGDELYFREINQPRIALWNLRFSQVMAGRKLFRTKKRSLGTGPKSLEVGDLVCVLAGGTVPYVVRPIEGGRDNKFRFVGEAYVHGTMHGEAVRAEGAMVQDIILV